MGEGTANVDPSRVPTKPIADPAEPARRPANPARMPYQRGTPWLDDVPKPKESEA